MGAAGRRAPEAKKAGVPRERARTGECVSREGR